MRTPEELGLISSLIKKYIDNPQNTSVLNQKLLVDVIKGGERTKFILEENDKFKKDFEHKGEAFLKLYVISEDLIEELKQNNLYGNN